MIRPPVVFRQCEGRDVWVSGPVVIQGILHRVEGGWVACNSHLNSMAWNVTEEASVCPSCYPVQFGGAVQLDLFGGQP